MTASPNTILLKGKPRTFELQAGVAINPGYICQPYLSTTLKVKPYSSAAPFKAPKLVALEQDYLGKGISITSSSYADAISVAYAIGDQVVMQTLSSGDEALLKLAASATAIVAGDLLELSSDGTVRKATGPVTDSTGGTGSLTFAAITAGSSYAQADLTAIKNAISEIATLLNTNAVFAMALEAVDNSSGSGEVFIRTFIF